MTAATLITLAALAAFSQPQPQPPAPPQPASTSPAKRPAQPTLDDLLNLPRANPTPAPPARAEKPPAATPPDPAAAELQRQLSVGETKELFDQAVDEMDQTATRLSSSNDTGIVTQRLQESAIRKLETLIDQARKQQSQSKSKQKQQQQQDQQKQQEQKQSSQQSAPSSDSNTQSIGPGRKDGAVGVAPGGSAAWGNLPEHVREALSQGKDDRYSALYKALTEKYYKRLAEEPRPGDLPRP